MTEPERQIFDLKITHKSSLWPLRIVLLCAGRAGSVQKVGLQHT